MLGFLKPRGELVELKGHQVVFLIDKRYARDSLFSVKLSTPAPELQKLELSVRVLSQRPGPDGRFVTVAVVESRQELQALTGRALRDSRRDPVRLTLKSGDLPGFRAVTEDLSAGGFRALLEGELVEGDVIEISFEFDEHPGFGLELSARVEWVQGKGGGRYSTGFSFVREERTEEGYQWLLQWLDSRGETEVRTLFKSISKTQPRPSVAKVEEPALDEAAREPLSRDLSVRIPFRGFLRGWAWEQGDDMVVVVLEDDDGVDHWLEFPGCRGLHARCRDRKIRLQGVKLVSNSPLIEEYSRSVSWESLYHFQFLDDFARVCLDIVATDCKGVFG